MNAYLLLGLCAALLFTCPGLLSAQERQPIGPARNADGVIRIISFLPTEGEKKNISAEEKANRWIDEHPEAFIIDIQFTLSVRDGNRKGIDSFYSQVAIVYRQKENADPVAVEKSADQKAPAS